MSAQRHPVAALLTDEMRARVRAARFEDYDGLLAVEDHPRICPLAVALGRSNSDIAEILATFGVKYGDPGWDAVWDFIKWADRPGHDPADVYALLGCAEPES
jgi:hypothetical protein